MSSKMCNGMVALSFAGLDPSLVGLSLAYIITLTGMLQYCVRISAEVENLVFKQLVHVAICSNNSNLFSIVGIS